jgi:hypothetical protein
LLRDLCNGRLVFISVDIYTEFSFNYNMTEVPWLRKYRTDFGIVFQERLASCRSVVSRRFCNAICNNEIVFVVVLHLSDKREHNLSAIVPRDSCLALSLHFGSELCENSYIRWTICN